MSFDKKKFAQLLIKAQGKRTLNQFGLISKVDPGYLSRFINMKKESPPSPEVLQKIADVAHNNVTYNDLMIAAGYLAKNDRLAKTDLDNQNLDEVKNVLYEQNPEPKSLEEYIKEAESLMLYGDIVDEKDKEAILTAIKVAYETAIKKNKEHKKNNNK